MSRPQGGAQDERDRAIADFFKALTILVKKITQKVEEFTPDKR